MTTDVETRSANGTLVPNQGDEKMSKKGGQATPPEVPGMDKAYKIDPYLVYFKRNDPECPFNFPLWKKWMIVLVIALQIVWVAGLGASWAPANADMAEEFGTSPLVMRIPQAMYLIGFAFGPVVLTPFAEDFGRKYTFTASCALLYIFQIPIALAPNYATLVVCRFIGGFVASPIFNSVCNIPDLWPSTDIPMAAFAINIWAFSAEIIVLAPIWGTHMNINYGWRWVWGISGIVGIIWTVVFFVLLPETRHTVLLERRAKQLRRKTGDDGYYAESERKGPRTINQVLTETLYRPTLMLVREPIVYLTALYDGLNYGIIYLAIEAVPLIYEEHGFHEPNVELLFLAIVVGYILAIVCYPIQYRLNKRLDERRGEKVPEGKLYWGFVAGVLFPVSLFLFAWLSIPSIHWFVGLIPLALFGTASHILFLMISDYTVDSYGYLASSAVTGQSLAREIMSAALIIVGATFYENVGYPEATTILAAIATVLGFIPFLFFYYGPKIRERSHFSQQIKEAARKDEERARHEEMADGA